MSDEQGSVETGNPTAPAAAPVTNSWYATDGLDEGTASQLGELVKAKGWKGPSDALLSYQNLEKVFGADKAGRTILAPKSDDDADGWSAVYDRLGRPESADKYDLPVPEGDDGSFAQAVAPVLHELGLTSKQAKGLAEWWNETSGARIEQEREAFINKSEQDFAALRREWGAAADQNVDLAKRALVRFGQDAGIDADGLERLEQAIGTGPMLKLFHSIGASFAEGSFVASDQPSGGAMTPQQAQNKIASMFADQEFMSRYMNPDERVRAGAIEEMERLHRMANPELMDE
jgi:hypothetical protein